MKARAARGMTLIELVVTIAIFGILVGLGLPSYRQWIRDTRIRNAAESVQNGLRLARGEAVKRSASVRFEFTAADNAGWVVCALGAGAATTCGNGSVAVIQTYTASGDTLQIQPNVTTSITAVPPGGFTTPLTALTSSPTADSSGVTFTSMGRPTAYGTTTAADPAGDLTRIDLTASPPSSSDHWLLVAIAAGGMVRLCDPQLSTNTSPQGCAP